MATADQTDPIGNQPGTVRGILALIFTAGMVAMVLMSAYRVQILDRPFISPDPLSYAFFFTGSTIVGLYFGLRSKQGIGGMPIISGDVNDNAKVSVQIQPAASSAAPQSERLGSLADLHAPESDPTDMANADRHLQVS